MIIAMKDYNDESDYNDERYNYDKIDYNIDVPITVTINE